MPITSRSDNQGRLTISLYREYGTKDTELWWVLSSIDELQRYAERFSHAVELLHQSAHLEADRLALYDKAGRFHIDHLNIDFGEYNRNMEKIAAIRDELELYSAWKRIAINDAAFTIYHFGQVLKAFSGRLFKCPTLFAAVSKLDLKAVTKLFAKHFPHYESIRNAIGHEFENRRDDAAISRNAIKGPFDDFSVRVEGKTAVTITHLDGTKYTLTYKNQLLTFDVSGQTRAKLDLVIEALLSALRNALKDQSLFAD